MAVTTKTISTKETRRKIDAHIGEQVRQIRSLRGFSQEKLGAQVDVTFQQMQKYERGANRISSSVLYEFSLILEVPIERFFEGLEKSKPNLPPKLDREHLTLIGLYDCFPKKVRKDIIQFLKAMKGGE